MTDPVTPVPAPEPQQPLVFLPVAPPAALVQVNKLAYLFAIISFAAVTAAAAILIEDKMVTGMVIAAFAPTVVGLMNMMKQDQQAVAQQATHVLVNSEMAAFKKALSQLALARDKVTTDKADARVAAAEEKKDEDAAPVEVKIVNPKPIPVINQPSPPQVPPKP